MSRSHSISGERQFSYVTSSIFLLPFLSYLAFGFGLPITQGADPRQQQVIDDLSQGLSKGIDLLTWTHNFIEHLVVWISPFEVPPIILMIIGTVGMGLLAIAIFKAVGWHIVVIILLVVVIGALIFYFVPSLGEALKGPSTLPMMPST